MNFISIVIHPPIHSSIHLSLYDNSCHDENCKNKFECIILTVVLLIQNLTCRRQLGICNPFGICGAQDRGRMFLNNKDEVFKDMIIGMMMIIVMKMIMVMMRMMMIAMMLLMLLLLLMMMMMILIV